MNLEQKIGDNLLRIKEKILIFKNRTGINQPITIVGVTKTHPPEIITAAVAAGLMNIGENRVLEAAKKFSAISKTGNTVVKHMIGHLQSNKANKAVEIFDRIDSVDSKKLAMKISKKAGELNKTIPVLLEINASREKQKHGFKINGVEEMLSCFYLDNIEIEGLMTVGPQTKDEFKIREAFSSLRLLLDEINRQLPKNRDKITTLSMGMSGDYQIGVEEGSTMIRVGTAIFGKRKNIA